jgi:hypothetical protein
MSDVISPTDGQTRLYNALVPKEGPKSVFTPLDFSLYSSYTVDFTLAYMNTTITAVQTVCVDNFANADDVLISVPGTGYTINVPAHSQGVFPIVAPIRPKITVTTAGTALVKCVWLNVPLPAAEWSDAINQLVEEFTFSASGALTVTGPRMTAAAGDAHTITTGGTAVTVFAAGEIPNGAIVWNPIGASETLYIDLVHPAQTASPGTNGTTFEIAPGTKFTIPGSMTGSVSLNAATSAHAFAAMRY